MNQLHNNKTYSCEDISAIVDLHEVSIQLAAASQKKHGRIMRNLILMVCICALCCSFIQPAQAQVNATDSLALVALYNSTNGPGWTNKTNWLTGPVSTWFGVTVGNGRVNNISLQNNNLNGILPSALGSLSALHDLQLSQNQLSGSIPVEIGNLTKLVQLFLFSNHLSGQIPAEIGNLSALQTLFLYENQLSGKIPPEIGNLTKLTQLILGSNQLSGSIPSEIGNLTALQILWLYYNQLSGTIPQEIGNLTQLIQLYLNNNQLSGSIPTGISNLTTLQYFRLDNNQFTNLSLLPASMINGATLGGNYFTFDDIVPNLSHISTYSPQAIVGDTKTSTVTIGSSYSINLGIDASLTTNVYKWYKDGVLYSTTSVNHLDFSSIKLSDAGVYTCTITNPGAPLLTLTSNPVTISVTGLQITTQPLSVSQCSGASATFSVAATGTTALTYSWRKNGTAIANTNKASYTIDNISATDAGSYDVVITDTNNASITSGAATLTVNASPTITGTTPGSVTGSGTVTLGATASAGATINWYPVLTNGTLLTSGTSFTTPSISQTTNYYVDATVNGCTSNPRTGVTATVTVETPLMTDSLALVALYNSTNGPGWTNKTNWLTGPVNTWYGVTVSNGRVNYLSLQNNNLNGTLPSALGNLSALGYLNLGNNKLSGSIPLEISNLTKITNLQLNNNQLNGSIPVGIGNLSDVHYLYLNSNQLSGTIPT